MSWSSEFVCLTWVVGSPNRPAHMGYANSLDGDTDLAFDGRTSGFARLDFHLQYSLNPFRCHLMTVSG